eukprot:bmy_14978T0
MTPACPLLLSVILSLRLAAAFDPAPSACSALASGVLYGAFSLQDLFPTIASGCSWTLENPDPTKYSLYLRFNRQEQVCAHFAPRLLPLDHYLVNFTCLRPSPDEAEAQAELGRPEEEEEAAGLELCGASSPAASCVAGARSAAVRLAGPVALPSRAAAALVRQGPAPLPPRLRVLLLPTPCPMLWCPGAQPHLPRPICIRGAAMTYSPQR